MPRLTPARGLVRPSAAPGPLTRDLGRVSILPRVKFRAVSAQKLDPAKGIEGAFEIVRPISRNLRRSVGAYIQILAEGVSAVLVSVRVPSGFSPSRKATRIQTFIRLPVRLRLLTCQAIARRDWGRN